MSPSDAAAVRVGAAAAVYLRKLGVAVACDAVPGLFYAPAWAARAYEDVEQCVPGGAALLRALAYAAKRLPPAEMLDLTAAAGVVLRLSGTTGAVLLVYEADGCSAEVGGLLFFPRGARE